MMLLGVLRDWQRGRAAKTLVTSERVLLLI